MLKDPSGHQTATTHNIMTTILGPILLCFVADLQTTRKMSVLSCNETKEAQDIYQQQQQV